MPTWLKYNSGVMAIRPSPPQADATRKTERTRDHKAARMIAYPLSRKNSDCAHSRGNRGDASALVIFRRGRLTSAGGADGRGSRLDIQSAKDCTVFAVQTGASAALTSNCAK